MMLVLEDGQTFHGRPFGALRPVVGEVVFNTGMTGYVEALTDPSYRGQILVLTYPLVGNYGVPSPPFESSGPQIQGLVVAHHAEAPHHHASVNRLGDWLAAHGIPGLCEVDTRSLTLLLRERGTQGGRLLPGDGPAESPPKSVEMRSIAKLVSPSVVTEHRGPGPRLLVIDTGAKESLVQAFVRRGAHVIRAPFHADWESHLLEVDGVVLTNGPGDPKDLMPLVERLRIILARTLPVLGICLGHQLLALAAGATTYKLKYGHRSQNQPVLDLTSSRAYITSQNHGYAVDEASLPADWSPWFVNLNDGTNEGIRHSFRPFWSVQFHPEGASGAKDTAFIFDDFLRMVGALKKGAAS